MDSLDRISQLTIEADTKILLLVLDGLGGLPQSPDGPTELEAAHTPHLDELASLAFSISSALWSNGPYSAHLCKENYHLIFQVIN